MADCLVVPLYGSLSTENQRKVFQQVDQGECRKVIFFFWITPCFSLQFFPFSLPNRSPKGVFVGLS